MGAVLERDLPTLIKFGDILISKSTIQPQVIQNYLKYSKDIETTLEQDPELRAMARGIIERYMVIIKGIVNGDLPPGQLNRVVTPGDISTLQLYLDKFASRPNQDPGLTTFVQALSNYLPPWEGKTLGDLLMSLGITVGTRP